MEVIKRINVYIQKKEHAGFLMYSCARKKKCIENKFHALS